jgi:hypothetical protein
MLIIISIDEFSISQSPLSKAPFYKILKRASK